MIEVAVEPRTKEDRSALQRALARLAAEDPAFQTFVDPESGQTILRGRSEAAIEVWLASLTEQGVGFNFGAPQVAYRETLGQAVEVDRVYSRVVGPKGDFARVTLRFEPGPAGSGFVFECTADAADVPGEFVPAVRAGLEAASNAGLIAGFPVIDFKATLTGGAFHDVDSSPFAFETAARAAFKELREKGAPKLLEPIMKVEVLTPDEYMGDVIGDLNSRRGQIQGTETRGNAQVVTAFVPLANMFGYINNLRSFSQGRAQFTMQYDHYDPVPQVVADEVIKKYA